METYLQGEANQEMSPAQYQSYISELLQGKRYVHYAAAGREPAAVQTQAASGPTPPVTLSLGYSLLNLAGLLVQQLLNLLASIGALVLALRRKLPLVARQIGLIGLAGMAILVLVRISGTIANSTTRSVPSCRC